MRVLLVMSVALAVLAALTMPMPGAGEPTVAAAQTPPAPPIPTGCYGLEPEDVKSPMTACRNYLFQMHCQFGVNEAYWEDWCYEYRELEDGEVPKCTVELAEQTSEIAVRCRNYLATNHCFGTHSSEANMEEFCQKVGTTAGPDPRPQPCRPELAWTPTAEGNLCWDKLVADFCQGWTKGDNTGAGDLNDFCDLVVGGAGKPVVNPNCDLALADQATDAGRACRAQLYASECQGLRARPEAIEQFCRTVSAEREQADQRPAEEEPEPEPEKPPDKPPSGSPNVLLQLGREPACDRKSELNDEVKRACALIGSVMHAYPFANYGIDNNVSVDVLDSKFWEGETPIKSLLQWLMVASWQGLLWLLKIALLIVQWAFGVDPLTRSMDKLTASVMAVFNLLGPEWRLTGLAILGAWGLWNGLIRLRVVDTFKGLAASVLLMIGAMWVVYDPKGTVGTIAHYANEGALVMLSATSSGELSKPGQGLANGQRVLFDQMILGPWCALQFGGLAACNAETGDREVSRAELWLSLPANSSAREILYKATREGPESIADETDENGWGDFFDAIGDGLCYYSGGLIDTCAGDEDIWKSQTQEDRENNPEAARQFDEAKAAAGKLVKKDPAAVTLQGQEGVFTRIGLFVVVAVGVLGAIVFLFTIGIRLLTAGLLALFLILLAPVMMIVAAFGEEGRSRFGAWLKMLLGAVVAKLVYSLILGLALVVLAILNDLNFEPVAGLVLPEPAFAQETPVRGGPGAADWLGNYILSASFLWMVVFFLPRILGLLAPDPGGEQGGHMAAAGALFLGQRMVGQAMRGAWEGATFLPRKVAPRALRTLRRQRAIGRHATETAIRGHADDELLGRARAAHRADFDARGARAAKAVADRNSDRYRGVLGKIDSQLGQARTPEARAGLERARAYAAQAMRKHQATERWGRSELARQAQGYQEPDEAQLRRARSQRQRDVELWGANDSTWSSDSNRHWAGISDDEWRTASERARAGDATAMDALRARSEAALQRDRTMLERSGDDSPLTRRTRNDALDEWGTHPVFDNRGRYGGYQSNPEFRAREREARRAARRSSRQRSRDNLWRSR